MSTKRKPQPTSDPRALWAHAERLRAEMEAAEERAVRAALVAGGWRVLTAAKLLDVPRSSLRRVIERHPSLEADLEKHSPGMGRPPIATPEA